MRRSASERIWVWVCTRFIGRRTYFCDEPWVGALSVDTDGNVVCCPCYARVSIGNVNDSSIREIWNCETLLGMRRAFRRGRLPSQCRGQLCPVVVGSAVQETKAP